MISGSYKWVAALAGALAVAACGSDGSDRGAGAAVAGEGAPLATVGDEVITTADVERRLEALSPYERARYSSAEQKRELLDNLIRLEVLAQEALRRGYGEHPDVVRTVKELMIQKMMEDRLAEIDPGEIPEEELRAFYEERRDEFHRPEEVRASILVVEDAARAETLAREAQGASPRAFRDLVEAHSIDAATRERGGDLRYFTRGTEELPAELVEAAFSADADEVIGPVYQGDDGTYIILKRTGYRAAVERSYDEVIPQIRNRLYRLKRTQAQAALIEELRADAAVEIREDALERVEIPSGAAAQTSGPASPREPPAEQRP